MSLTLVILQAMELLKPLIRNEYPVTIEEVRSNKQKEHRIIDTLELVLNSHRLILDPKVITNDYQSALTYPIETQSKYMLLYQLSRITRERGSLAQDDRLDALAIAVAYWVEQMAADVNKNILDRKQELLHEELTKFTDSFYKRKR